MESNVKELRVDASKLNVEESELLQLLKKIASHHKLTNVVSTHYMGARALASLKSRGEFERKPLKQVKTSWINTDYFVGYFPRISQYLDKTFVAHEQLRQVWINRGVPRSQIEASGMPIPPIASQALTTKQKKNIFRDLDFSYDPKAILITIATGGTGVGDFEQMVKSIENEFAKDQHPVRIIAVPAKDKLNYTNLMNARESLPKNLELKVFKGFIPKSDLLRYIQASDIYITKAGGLSPTEAFMLRKPVLLMNLFGGHERENARFFDNLKVAKVIDEYDEIALRCARSCSQIKLEAA